MNRFLIISILAQFLMSSAIAYEAHEWGTFTSLVGSDGAVQDGMYHEDEPLPDFVHGFGETQFVFNPLPPLGPDECFNMKVCFNPVVFDNNIISQKMETPVIYFYGDKNERVEVDVRFPEGIITDTFPAPTVSMPQNSDDLIIENGHAKFVVDLLPNTTLQPPHVEADNIYGHARKVDSLMVKTNQEVEKFIFYRGLGRFQPRMGIRSIGDDFFFKTSHSDRPLAAFLVYKKVGSKPHMLPVIDEKGDSFYETITKDIDGRYRYFHVPESKIAELRRGGSYPEVPVGPAIQVGGTPFETLTKALVNNGLKLDEAEAMVNTWANGYFKTPGLRMLYILPKREVDEILPLNFNPAPTDVERVFVARLEIMTEKNEFDLVSAIIAEKESFDVSSLGRLAEPQLRRAREVYQQQSLMFQSEIPNFEYGLFDLFDKLVDQSKDQNQSPAVVQ